MSFEVATEAELAAWLREILKNKLADALRDRQRDKRDVRRECSFDEGIDASFSRTEGWLFVCFSCDDGKQLWSKDFDKEYGVARQTWGFCDYPLVDGDVLICVPGGSEATVVALNRHTGNEVWRRVLVPAKTSTRPLRSAHTATMRGSMPGFDYYVVGTDQAIYFINRTDGRLLASYEEFHPATAFSHTPLFDNSDLIVTNGYKGGVARLAISLEGQVMSLKEIFRGRQSLDAFEDSGILVDARPACIYLCRWTTLHFFYRWQGHFDRCELERSIVAEAKITDLASIEASDLFKADLTDVDVLAICLYPVVMDQLKKQIENMHPGAIWDWRTTFDLYLQTSIENTTQRWKQELAIEQFECPCSSRIAMHDGITFLISVTVAKQ